MYYIQIKYYLCIFNFVNISKLFSKIAVSVYTPTSKIWTLLFHIFANIWYWQSIFWGKGRVRVKIGFFVYCVIYFFEITFKLKYNLHTKNYSCHTYIVVNNHTVSMPTLPSLRPTTLFVNFMEDKLYLIVVLFS